MPPTNEIWPPKAGLSTHVVSSRTTILTISGSAIINAPPEIIFQTLRNTAGYPSWNTFCPTVTINSQPDTTSDEERSLLSKDTVFTFHVAMDSNKANKLTDSQMRLTDFSTPTAPSSYLSEEELSQGSFEPDLSRVWRIAWTTCGGFVSRGLSAERFNEIIELGEGRGCLYRTWECQGGILARTVKWLYEKTLNEKFQLWCEDLKRACEGSDREGELHG